MFLVQIQVIHANENLFGIKVASKDKDGKKVFEKVIIFIQVI